MHKSTYRFHLTFDYWPLKSTIAKVIDCILYGNNFDKIVNNKNIFSSANSKTLRDVSIPENPIYDSDEYTGETCSDVDNAYILAILRGVEIKALQFFADLYRRRKEEKYLEIMEIIAKYMSRINIDRAIKILQSCIEKNILLQKVYKNGNDRIRAMIQTLSDKLKNVD